MTVWVVRSTSMINSVWNSFGAAQARALSLGPGWTAVEFTVQESG